VGVPKILLEIAKKKRVSGDADSIHLSITRTKSTDIAKPPVQIQVNLSVGSGKLDDKFRPAVFRTTHSKLQQHLRKAV
jgi:hypothetical protein